MTATIRSPSPAVSFGAADHAGDADRHTQGQLGKIPPYLQL